ncbi:hypothetical protein [Cellulomonas sp.]|uniref:hypothetical protein n=1 Tax=Cellulomonas sp. TaxID=40001 RepID=UPI002584FA61|nr:hypothetical protein [Cellulomonas sp.]MCR6688872.1 hypothetical protein [Cellulomonas sp.]
MLVGRAVRGQRERPQAPAVARPDEAAAGFDEYMGGWVVAVGSAIDSGDPDALRDWLVADGGCRDVVADPQDPQRTIVDVLAG